MNHAQLSDVQISNLTLLLTIRDGVLHDKIQIPHSLHQTLVSIDRDTGIPCRRTCQVGG